MTFLIRAAFWLSLVILILPAEPGNESMRERISTTQAITAAQATFSDLSSFCMRQPDVCAAGEVAIESFSAKARFGAKQIYMYLDGENEVAQEKPREMQTIATEASQASELDRQQMTELVMSTQ